MARTTRTTRKFEVLDSWGYIKGDATQDNVRGTIATFRANWAHRAGLQIRTFHRHVRAGGAYLPVTVIVARAPKADDPSLSGIVFHSLREVARDGQEER